MNFKEKFIEGNNFIFSPFGTIKPIRYVIYALILEILYKLSFSAATVFQKNTPILGWTLFLIALLIVVMKAFNYKKRFQDFIGNNIIAVTLTTIYISIGAFIQEYLYLLKLSVNKSAYELSTNVEGYSQYQSTFQDYANINIPSFIGSNWGQSVFYLVTAVGIIMFLFLIFTPSARNINEGEHSININRKNILYWLLSLIIAISISVFGYQYIKCSAYHNLTYQMSDAEADYLNVILENQYQQVLKDTQDYNKRPLIVKYSIPVKPIRPQLYGKKYPKNNGIEYDIFTENKVLLGNYRSDIYSNQFDIPSEYRYEYETLNPPSLVSAEFSYFDCSTKTLEIFGEKCGNLDLKYGTIYTKDNSSDTYNPKVRIILLYILSLPLGILLNFIIFRIFHFLPKLFEQIKRIKQIKLPKVKKNNNSELTKKLEELNDLKNKGLITEEDYNLTKENLLKDFRL